MDFIFNSVSELKAYKKLNSYMDIMGAVAVTGLNTEFKANIIGTLCHFHNVRAFCVASDEKESQVLCNDLCTLGIRACVYPLRDMNFREVSGISREYEHQRLKVLTKLNLGECDVVIGTIDALLQYTMPKEVLEKATLKIQAGQQISVEKCVDALTLLGYERTDMVEGTGQFSVRGGILDFFVPDNEYPVRVEFWGDEIDSINYFDIESQRRFDKVERIMLSPSNELLVEDKHNLAQKIIKKANSLRSEKTAKAKEILYRDAEAIESGVNLTNLDKYISLVYDKPETVFDYFDKEDFIFISEHTRVGERVKGAEFQYKEDMTEFFSQGILCKGLDKFSMSYKEFIEEINHRHTVFLDNFTSGHFDLPLSDIVTFNIKQLPLWNGAVSVLCEDLSGFYNERTTVVILAGTEKSAKNLALELNEKGFRAKFVNDLSTAQQGNIYVIAGALSGGFELLQTDFHLITYGQTMTKPNRKVKSKKQGKEIYSLAELSKGDYVVHSTHGIGVFSGIHKLDVQGVKKDYIKITYAKGDVLYVPVTQLDLVAKYIGPRENDRVKLSRLGSSDWQRTKSRVRTAVKDMAKELSKLYTERMQAKGYAFSPDGEWQRDFEAKFMYDETPDQLRCADEIKGDMERLAPMDRLLCGDVGFGKTEVALRAAFKCVCDSKQCAILCPTTILAWQHYQSILNRFDDYPVRIELLSRFRTQKQQKEILEKLKRGEIDIVVGTHRLVQKDVVFRDLGLAIIDEEQRFGVAHKERFKEVCKNVDVLTLSATPIPRTLNMAMSGIRDMSVLEEAPTNRQPVQTYVLEYDPAVIHEAIRRELRRGGQVFYLHNNVESISAKAVALSEAIPEAKIAVGHGKMSENELSDIWAKMINQEINVLVCTTIIETGVDLPNANTLIIENADNMGLSQLHQLRGRVGRSPRRAYAYFTFNPHKVLSDISQKRLNAIREFTEFGSGFKIAMRDLELRGAGNILSGQQHGHMEDVGYDMYLKLLDEAVKEEKGEKSTSSINECTVDIQMDAHIPESYIESLSLRLDAYKRIADIKSSQDYDDVVDELCDRYGDMPEVVIGLCDIALIRNRANHYGIKEIKQNENTILLCFDNLNNPDIYDLIGNAKGKAVLTPSQNPYITLSFGKKDKALNALIELFREE
ncbi:MAG: transcription-repair coupling factor [Oscillospiraceae bacterium]|nr:transcription-repair coupling factor [Oscillospiraceae bacterium]